MPSFDPPINPTAVTAAVSVAGTTTGDAKGTSTQDFVAMLADLLSAGAEVVAAPIGANEQIDGEVDTETEDGAAGVIDPALAAAMLLQSVATQNAVLAKEGTEFQASGQTGEEGQTALLRGQSEAAGDSIVQDETLIDVAAKTLPELGAKAAANDRDFAAELLAVDRDPRTANANALTHASGNQPARHTAEVQARVGTPAWADEVATRVSFVHDRGMHTASLKLSPEHLGPLEIQITVQDDRATVWFGAAHAETRTALEQALPRLRELLQSQGLSLTDAGVFREPPREQARGYRQQNDAFGKTLSDDRVILATSGRTSLIDAYA